MKSFPIFFLLITTSAFAKCEKLFQIYGTLDLAKKTWTTESGQKEIDWCIPLTDKGDNIHVAISRDKKNFETTIQKTLITHWDEIRPGGKLRGGVVPMKSVMIQVPVPEWFKGAKITVTDLDSKEIIATGVM